MAEYVENPRRTPRAVIGCDARVALKDGRFFAGATIDCGPQGCQIVAPSPLARDERVFVELKGAGVDETVWFSGRIVWAAEGPPFRAGVHFDDGCFPGAGGFFARLAAAHPDAVSAISGPARVSAEARLVPGSAAADEPLHPGEAEVLRAVGEGLRIRELRERLGERWEPCLNAIFSLLARRALTVEGSAPGDPAP